MSNLISDLTTETKEILTTKWDVRDGTVVPETTNVTLKDGAVKIDGTFLYADLAASSKLAQVCPWETTAKIIRAYLHIAVRLIRAHGGEIRSFDGDRVMGVFIGDSKNSQASRCARKLFWMTEDVLSPTARREFKSVENNDISIRQCVGIDTGTAVAVRAGIRNNNDLIWIGRAPSFAAKLSDVREHPYCVYLSEACHKRLADDELREGSNEFWQQRTIQFAGGAQTIYRTAWRRRP